jgi:hypothetical protein
VSCCANMIGEKEPLIVIGKSPQPRCFGKVDPKSLPVIYRNNKKAWNFLGLDNSL